VIDQQAVADEMIFGAATRPLREIEGPQRVKSAQVEVFDLHGFEDSVKRSLGRGKVLRLEKDPGNGIRNPAGCGADE
jgi:hypothetical protein